MSAPRYRLTVTVRIEDDRMLPAGVVGINAAEFGGSGEPFDVLDPDQVDVAMRGADLLACELLGAAMGWARAEREP